MQSLNNRLQHEVCWWFLVATISLLSFWRILALGNGNTFFFDEWNFLLDRNEFSFANTFKGHNGHLSAIPVTFYQIMIRIFGGGTYAPYRLCAALLHCLIAVAGGVLIRRNSGNAIALAGIATVGFMGVGWQNWLWGFQIGMELSVLSGLIALIFLTRGDSRFNQNVVGVGVAIAILSSGVGISVAVGIGLAALIRRRTTVLIWLLGVLALYGIWNVFYGQSQARIENMPRTPKYIADSASGAFGGLGGWSRETGALIAGAALVLIVQFLLRRKPGSAEVSALLVICLVGWALSGLSRAHLAEPGASRYVHVGISWLVPIMGISIAGQSRSGTLKKYLAITLAFLASWATWDIASGAGREFRERSLIVRAEIEAARQIISPVDPAYQLDPARAPQIHFGPLMKFADSYSLPTVDFGHSQKLPENVLSEVDRVFLQAPSVSIVTNDRPVEAECSVVASNYVDSLPPGSRVWFKDVHSVEVQRFAASRISMVPESPGMPSTLTFGIDRTKKHWIVKFVSAGPFELCKFR